MRVNKIGARASATWSKLVGNRAAPHVTLIPDGLQRFSEIRIYFIGFLLIAALPFLACIIHRPPAAPRSARGSGTAQASTSPITSQGSSAEVSPPRVGAVYSLQGVPPLSRSYESGCELHQQCFNQANNIMLLDAL
jgi:hypothetical protein